nr:NAD(P)H-dependent oxidoreductase [Campylobacter sp.]
MLDGGKDFGTGRLATNKKYMISTTWNASITAFKDKNEFFEGRGYDGVTFAMHKAMEFCGMKAMPSFICNDVIKNPKTDEYINIYKEYIRANF